jgi:hypothetical protein
VTTVYEAAGAVFDPTHTYRYSLTRRWGRGSTVLWILLNASSADATRLDPTARRCEGFSRAWGYDGMELANLCALVATDPRALARHPDPVGPDNAAAIAEALARADLVVAGWGECRTVRPHARAMRRILRARRRAAPGPVVCLGLNADGSPRHPLYLPADTPRVPYAAAR